MIQSTKQTLSTHNFLSLIHIYVAKRMEIGAVVGAAPAENVIRLVPSPSDVIILLGGDVYKRQLWLC